MEGIGDIFNHLITAGSAVMQTGINADANKANAAAVLAAEQAKREEQLQWNQYMKWGMLFIGGMLVIRMLKG